MSVLLENVIPSTIISWGITPPLDPTPLPVCCLLSQVVATGPTESLLVIVVLKGPSPTSLANVGTLIIPLTI